MRITYGVIAVSQSRVGNSHEFAPHRKKSRNGSPALLHRYETVAKSPETDKTESAFFRLAGKISAFRMRRRS